jgi:hypothetical protein
MTPPLLKDGTPFKLGMTLYKNNGFNGQFHVIPTAPETHDVDSFEYCGEWVHCINRKGSGSGTDLRGFYPSQEAFYDEKIAQLEGKKREIDAEIAAIRKWRNPPPVTKSPW